MKTITVLGSTGSIGRNVLEIVSLFPEDFKVIGLTCNRNIDLLIEQIKKFSPEIDGIREEEKADYVKKIFPELSVEGGEEGLKKVAKRKSDLVVVAIVGISALFPTLEAIRNGNNIALANKEILVAGGKLFMDEVKKSRITLFPLDSEHCAIFQILEKLPRKKVKNVIITASGGPFYNLSKEEINNITPQQALKHPVWKMGKKITIDSASLMNKGFEVITAHWLFDLNWENIKVVVHPEAVIHAMVEMIDGTTFALFSQPDMRIPIQFVLNYPERKNSPFSFSLSQFSKLSFQPPDENKFPALRLAKEAGKKGGTYPAVLNACNEYLVEAFISGKIKFPQIWEICEEILQEHKPCYNLKWEEIMDSDKWAREKAKEAVEKLSE